jgi:hypothetical protein
VTYTVASAANIRDLKPFLRLPQIIYGRDPNWVAPLTSEVYRTLDTGKNPYFSRATLRVFVCLKDGSPAARLVVVISKPHAEKYGQKTAFFGFFESANEPDVSRALFQAAEDYCRAEGVRVLEGPFNPNHYSELGLQVDRFGTPPAFFQTYNPPYYPDLLEQAGFRVSQRFQTMKNEEIGPYLLKRYSPPQRVPEKSGFVVRPFRPGDLVAELDRIREVNNDAFSDNWHFLPLSREEYLFSAKYLSLVTKPELILIAEHRGSAVGVLHCVLDINPLLRKLGGRVNPFKYIGFLRGRRSVRNLIIFTVAIRKEYRHSRVYYLLLQAFCRTAASCATLETTWLSPENLPALRAAESLGMIPDKHFAIYRKALTAKV